MWRLIKKFWERLWKREDRKTIMMPGGIEMDFEKYKRLHQEDSKMFGWKEWPK
jgi:hypothetical protein